MKIFITAHPHAKKSSLEQLDKTHFIIAVKEPPSDNKANIAIAKALAMHFHIPLSGIRLLSGQTSRKKIFTISSTGERPGPPG
ncbi:DUF167 domain-containing protein [Candidatus Peregrinibacteria bacterium]|nr:DUF167 domain-containing protein [Candidatus Peregrinibacteria bacterium]